MNCIKAFFYILHSYLDNSLLISVKEPFNSVQYREIDGEIDRQMERQIDRWRDRQVDGEIDRQMERQIDRWRENYSTNKLTKS